MLVKSNSQEIMELTMQIVADSFCDLVTNYYFQTTLAPQSRMLCNNLSWQWNEYFFYKLD